MFGKFRCIIYGLLITRNSSAQSLGQSNRLLRCSLLPWVHSAHHSFYRLHGMPRCLCILNNQSAFQLHIYKANGQVACRSSVETLWLLVTVINADYMVLTSYHAQLLGPQVLLFIVPIIPCGSSTSFSKKRLH